MRLYTGLVIAVAFLVISCGGGSDSENQIESRSPALESAGSRKQHKVHTTMGELRNWGLTNNESLAVHLSPKLQPSPDEGFAGESLSPPISREAE